MMDVKKWTPQHEVSDLTFQAIDAFISDPAIVERSTDRTSEETFTHCLVCDDWEGHRPGCPIRQLEKLIAQG